MPQTHEQAAALTRVQALVKPAITYDHDSERYRLPNVQNYIGTHGLKVRGVARMALHGKFVGGEPGNHGQFFLTANKRYGKWDQTVLAAENVPVKGSDTHPFIKAIEYAESSEAYEAGDEFEPEYTSGNEVVITFNKNALVEGTTLHLSNSDDSPELILPHAPAIETIAGIYPVGRSAAQMLARALTNERQLVLASRP